jgi:hypothetical protein
VHVKRNKMRTGVFWLVAKGDIEHKMDIVKEIFSIYLVKNFYAKYGFGTKNRKVRIRVDR